MAASAESTHVEPRPTWAPQEKWVWQRVSEKKIADFNEEPGYGGKLHPKEPQNWPTRRVLSSEFLETILLTEPYRSATSHAGLRIVGAWFKEPLNLSSARLSYPLWLCECRFDESVYLTNLRTSHLIAISGSEFSGRLNMNGLQVGESLFMREGAKFVEVDLRSAKINGQVDIASSEFTGRLNMDGLQVDGPLFMREGAKFVEVDLVSAKINDQLSMIRSEFTGRLNMNGIQVGHALLMSQAAKFAEVDLGGGEIKGQVSMIRSEFTGRLNMNGLQVGHALLMHEGAKFAEVDLGTAKINGQVAMASSEFTGPLNMNGIQVGESLIMSEGAKFAEMDLGGGEIKGQVDMASSEFTGPLNMDSIQVGGSLFMSEGAKFAEVVKGDAVGLTFSEIGGNLDISGSEFPSLNLTGTKIHGELRLGSDLHQPVRWHQDATLTLRNTEIGALQDRKDGWPEKLILDGFTYTHLGGFAGESSDVSSRETNWWFKEWLTKCDYSPQPYEQLARVLESAGYKDKANEILYARKRREWTESGFKRKSWMALEYLFIGYGFRIRRSLYWLIFLTGIGVGLLIHSSQSPTGSPIDDSFYTLDTLLPIIKLDPSHDKITPTGNVKYYFYFLKMMGFVLASFLIAGLSGLTKK